MQPDQQVGCCPTHHTSPHAIAATHEGVKALLSAAASGSTAQIWKKTCIHWVEQTACWHLKVHCTVSNPHVRAPLLHPTTPEVTHARATPQSRCDPQRPNAGDHLTCGGSSLCTCTQTTGGRATSRSCTPTCGGTLRRLGQLGCGSTPMTRTRGHTPR